MNDVITSDLAQFGYRERWMLCELLTAWNRQGLPDDFYDDEVVPTLNRNSGGVFLTNSEYEVAMLNGDKLESWYWLSGTGREGFYDELKSDFDYDGETWDETDREQFVQIMNDHGDYLEEGEDDMELD